MRSRYVHFSLSEYIEDGCFRVDVIGCHAGRYNHIRTIITTFVYQNLQFDHHQQTPLTHCQCYHHYHQHIVCQYNQNY